MKKFLLSILLAFMPVIVLGAPAVSTSTQACWTAPTTFTNGDPVTAADILGYFVYYTQQGGKYTDTARIAISDPSTVCINTSQFPTTLTDGNWDMAVTALGAKGESNYSTDLGFTVTKGVVTIQKKLLSAPAGLSAQ